MTSPLQDPFAVFRDGTNRANLAKCRDGNISTLVLQAELARVQRQTSGDRDTELKRRQQLIARRRKLVDALLNRGKKVMESAVIVPTSPNQKMTPNALRSRSNSILSEASVDYGEDEFEDDFEEDSVITEGILEEDIEGSDGGDIEDDVIAEDFGGDLPTGHGGRHSVGIKSPGYGSIGESIVEEGLFSVPEEEEMSGRGAPQHTTGGFRSPSIVDESGIPEGGGASHASRGTVESEIYSEDDEWGSGGELLIDSLVLSLHSHSSHSSHSSNSSHSSPSSNSSHSSYSSNPDACRRPGIKRLQRGTINQIDIEGSLTLTLTLTLEWRMRLRLTQRVVRRNSGVPLWERLKMKM